MSKHTPGPWVATKGRDVIANQEQVICTAYVPNDNGDREEAQANARLIAAAPDLYEALRNLVMGNEDHNAAIETVLGRPPGWNDEYLAPARAALAKATSA